MAQDVLTIIVAVRGSAISLTIPFDPEPKLDAVIADVAAEATAEAIRSLLRRHPPRD